MKLRAKCRDRVRAGYGVGHATRVRFPLRNRPHRSMVDALRRNDGPSRNARRVHTRPSGPQLDQVAQRIRAGIGHGDGGRGAVACNKAGAERGADREAKGVMDARRIAEIRELAATWLGPARADLIALCDLAERGLDVAQAIEDELKDITRMRREDGHSDWKDGYESGVLGVRRRLAEILSNPKHERRG